MERIPDGSRAYPNRGREGQPPSIPVSSSFLPLTCTLPVPVNPLNWAHPDRWHDLDQAPYKVSFNSSNMVAASGKLGYPKAALRMSLSSIPYPSHISLKLNSEEVDLTPAFSPDWAGVKDRRWVELPLPGLPAGLNDIVIELTGEGKAEPAGQGGKMMTSIEIMEFGGDERSVPLAASRSLLDMYQV